MYNIKMTPDDIVIFRVLVIMFAVMALTMYGIGDLHGRSEAQEREDIKNDKRYKKPLR